MISALPDGEKRLSRVNLSWRVDSPMGRLSVNKLQGDLTCSIKEAVGIYSGEKPKPKSPFEPPEWLLVATLMAFILCLNQGEKYDDYKKQAAQERKAQQEQLDKERAQREEAERMAAEEQAQRDAYNKQMQEKFQQDQEEQRRKADELLQQQRSQWNNDPSNSYTPNPNPFTRRLDQSDGFFSNRKYATPFTTPITPGTSPPSGDTGSTPWRSRY